MNRLIRMLRLILCIYFGLVSAAAWGDSFEDALQQSNDAENVTSHRITETEAQARKTERETQDALIEKGWSCDPSFVADDYPWRRFSGRSFISCVLLTSDVLLKFRGCLDQGVSQEIRREFIRKYVTFFMKKTGESGYPFGYDEAERKFEEGEYEPDEMRVRKTSFEEDKKKYLSRMAEQEKARKQAAEEAAVKIRQGKLKRGELPIANFNDAVLLHEPKNLSEVMYSPLLKPDNSLYAAVVIVDGEEGNLIRVKIGGGRDMLGGWVDVAYAVIRQTKKTVDYSQHGMRIGGGIKVMGRYVQNKKYTTLAGEGKTIPVLEVMYLGD